MEPGISDASRERLIEAYDGGSVEPKLWPTVKAVWYDCFAFAALIWLREEQTAPGAPRPDRRTAV